MQTKKIQIEKEIQFDGLCCNWKKGHQWEHCPGILYERDYDEYSPYCEYFEEYLWVMKRGRDRTLTIFRCPKCMESPQSWVEEMIISLGWKR